MQDEVKIAGSQVHRLTSETIDQPYLINVATPPSYNATGKPCPVVYVTDGGPAFLALSAVVPMLQLAGELKPFITVGMTYDVENSMDAMTLRTRDLTHCAGDMVMDPESTPEWMKKLPVAKPGGAANFLEFINGQVKPLIQQHYNTAPDEDIYAGYSLGGLFGLYTLFNKPDSFNRYVIGSPSIWWNKKDILTHEQSYSESHRDLNASVYLSAGRLEESEKKPDQYGMVSNLLALVKTLEARKYEHLNLTHQVIADETHMSCHPVALVRGLRKVIGH